jgi:4'-phosphopantetheinyl transferase
MIQSSITVIHVASEGQHPLAQQLLRYIPHDKQEKLRKFYFTDDFNRGLFSEALARALVVANVGLPHNQIMFSHNEFGKPFLPTVPDFHFNLSHSGSWVVCAVAGSPVGIDVEQIKKIDLGIARRFFSPTEHRHLMSLPPELRNNYFFTLWSLKESYIKALGKGLSIPLHSFSINALSPHISLEIHDPSLCHTFFKLYDLQPDYKLALCSTHQHALPATFHEINATTILDMLEKGE